MGRIRLKSSNGWTTPTTYIDEGNVARVPKRADMFARAQFGDMGKTLQDAVPRVATMSARPPPAFAQRRALGAFVLLQDGDSAEGRETHVRC